MKPRPAQLPNVSICLLLVAAAPCFHGPAAAVCCTMPAWEQQAPIEAETPRASQQPLGPLAGPVFARWEDLPGFAALTRPSDRGQVIQSRIFRNLLERYNLVLWQIDLTQEQAADFRERIETFRDETTRFTRAHGQEIRRLLQTMREGRAEREDGQMHAAYPRLVELDRARPHLEELIIGIWEDLSPSQQQQFREMYGQLATDSPDQMDMDMAMDGYERPQTKDWIQIDPATQSDRERRALEQLRARDAFLSRIASQDGGLPVPDVAMIVFDFEKTDSKANTDGG